MALIARWRLENNGLDETGNYNLTQDAVTYSAWRIDGNYSGVYDGVNSFGSQISTPIPATGDWTFACWARTNWGASFRYLVTDYNPGTTKGIRITGDNDSGWRCRLQLADGVQDTYYSDKPSFANDSSGWHHLIVVVDRGNALAHFYVDGNLLTGDVDISATAGSIASSAPFYLSSNRDVNGWWNGGIDDARLYDTALTAAEGRSLYNDYYAPTALHLGSNV